MVQSFDDVITLFGGPAAYARAVGMTPGAAKQAQRRKSISAKWFNPTVKAAQDRQLPITLETLASLAERAA